MRLEDSSSVTMKNAVFWDVTPCGSCRNGCFGGTYLLHHQGGRNQRARNVSTNYQLLVTTKVVPSSLILFTLTMETIRSSETSVVTRATLHHIPEDSIKQYKLCFIV
jgi:hypothetical protein